MLKCEPIKKTLNGLQAQLYIIVLVNLKIKTAVVKSNLAIPLVQQPKLTSIILPTREPLVSATVLPPHLETQAFAQSRSQRLYSCDRSQLAQEIQVVHQMVVG